MSLSRLFFLSALLTFCSGIQAQTFEDYLRSQQDNTTQQFNQFRSKHEDEFEKYKRDLQQAFREYKKSVSRVWGVRDSRVPENKTDVSYQDNLKQRNIIDFEKGEVKVELALSADEARDPRLVQKKMQNAIKATLNRGTETRSIIDLAKKPDNSKTKGPAVLNQLIIDPHGKTVTNKTADEFARQQSKKVKARKIKGTDNKPRVIVSTQFAMIPEHFKVQAKKYKPHVDRYADAMKIPSELVYAVIETESAFNPNARSSVPAFGLMQLVPTSGARDAYRLLYNKDKVVTDRYLYNPENNIRLGTAFIHKLYYQYLDGIQNAEARTWAAIAAYNTGAGNIFNTFAGKYRRSQFGNRSNWKNKALSIINNKTPEQVYQYMKRNLPHKETQHYIQNIRKRITKYQSF